MLDRLGMNRSKAWLGVFGVANGVRTAFLAEYLLKFGFDLFWRRGVSFRNDGEWHSDSSFIEAEMKLEQSNGCDIFGQSDGQHLFRLKIIYNQLDRLN